MSNVANIGATLSLNNSDFNRKIEESERRAATFAGRAQAKFEGLFKRTPGRRSERAISGLIGDLSGGDLATAVSNFGGKITGLGLGMGVALGAGIELFNKIRESVKETDIATRNLNNTFALLGGNRGPEQIAKDIKTIHDQTSELSDKSSGTTSKVGDFLRGWFNPSKRRANRDEDVTRGLNEELGQRKELNKAEADNLFLKERAERVGKTGANIAGVFAKLQEQKSTEDRNNIEYFEGLNEKFQKGQLKPGERNRLVIEAKKAAQERKTILQRDAKDQIDDITRVDKAKTRSNALAEKLAKLASVPRNGRGFTPDEQKKMAAAYELQDVDDRLKTARPDEKAALQIERIQKMNALREVAKPTDEGKNPFAWGTEASRNFDSDSGKDFGSIAKRTAEMNDSSVFGSLGYNAAQRGEVAAPKAAGNLAAQQLKEQQTTNQLIREALLE